MKSFLLALVCWNVAACAQTPNAAFDPARVDAIVNDAIQTNLIPGAVIVIGHNGQVVYQHAYGYRVLIPERQPMQLDTIFDVASLTKVTATTPSVMKLFEQGKLRIDDLVTKYLPEFEGGKSDLTIRLLMTHFSGLPPDVDLVPKWSGYQNGIDRALNAKPTVPAGTRFIYSDINFLLMGEIVRRLSGQSLAEFAHDQIYAPLGMTEATFQPPATLRPRIESTEIDDETGQPLWGVVHDPTARYMGGVAGHAGLFATAADLTKYAEMLLGMGQLNGVRVFTPETVKKFTEPASPADQPILRALGWDIDSPFSSNRGELFPIGSYGHTGYTGTSMWMDPTSNTFIIFLTNVVHPKHGNSLSSVRSRLATTVAASFGLQNRQAVAITGYVETMAGAGVHRAINRQADTRTGLDVLAEDGFRALKGKRVGLITNQTGIDRSGNRNIDLMLASKINIAALFSPEHGIEGKLDEENVTNAKDTKTGLPVISLYKPSERRLTAEQMRGLDAVVFDIQDVGARFWTYSCTMLYALEEAGKAHKPFYILDRPNPITGVHVEGPVLDKDLQAFTGCYDMPLRHGMTFGELAQMANSEQHWGADLHVVKMKNWQRGDWFDSTSLEWINPSPNMRGLNAALLYPGIGMLEFNTNYSVGRGTDAPFEQVGADWIKGPQLAQALNSRMVPGVRAYPTKFKPTASNFQGQEIEGIRFVITDRESFDSTRLGIELAAALQSLYPGKIDFDKVRLLIANHALIEGLKSGQEPTDLWLAVQAQAASFIERRKPYLLY